MFGIIHQDSTFCLALNHLVTIGKYFLYVNALNSKDYVLHKRLKWKNTFRVRPAVKRN